MSGLANSGIKETKEALKSAIEEIAELEAELEAWKSDGPIAKARATTKHWKEKCDRLEAELRKTVLGYETEHKKLREALESIANSTCCGDCQEASRVAKAALVKDES